MPTLEMLSRFNASAVNCGGDMAKDRPVRQPSKVGLEASIMACLENGERLVDDAMQLEFQEPASTKLTLPMIAQEEFAKGFLLELVRHDIIPWSAAFALRRAACVRLLPAVYLPPAKGATFDNNYIGHRQPRK